MMRALIVIVGLIAVVIGIANMGPSVNMAAFQSLRADITKCRSILARDQALGLIKNIRREPGSTTIEVNDNLWPRQDRDTRISLGLAAYCTDSADDGRYKGYLTGFDGGIRGSVNNGNWFDP
jgi:hypothetical protein